MAAPRCFIALLAALAAALFGHPAHAEPSRAPEQPSSAGIIEMLQNLDRLAPRGSSLAHHLARVGLSDEYGLVYTRNLDLGDRGMQLRIGGPVLGHSTDIGLSFEIRF